MRIQQLKMELKCASKLKTNSWKRCAIMTIEDFYGLFKSSHAFNY
jgi:hypothetical protein